jgi:Flp pilus assembly protein TadG
MFDLKDLLATSPRSMLTQSAASARRLVSRFLKDRSGSYVTIFAISLPALVGVTAFGTEEGLLLYDRQTMQHAADSSAASAAVAYSSGVTSGSGVKSQASSVAASYGFVDRANNISVTVNQPPSAGKFKNTSQAIEVIISQPQPRLFSALWSSSPIPVTARAVALPKDQACILALNPTANSSFSQQGSVNTQLVHCAVMDNSTSATALSIGGSAKLSTNFVGVVGGISGKSSITATDGMISGYHVVNDPYANVSFPSYSGCTYNNYSTHGTVTLSPGVYCGGMNLGAGAAVTLNPGIYYLDRGSLSMTGSASLSGTGVTIVFTSSTGSNYATANISGGATLNLTAPTSGPTAGIALFGDRSMPRGTSFGFTGGNLQTIGGAVYLSKGAISWAGNASVTQRCTQIIGDTIQMVGDSGLSIDCSGYGTKAIASAAALLE